MKEMLARHKGKLILSSLVILLPILPAAFAGQTLFLWEPVLLLVSQWVIMLVVLHANRNKEQSPKVLNLVAWILPVLSCYWASLASLPRAARIRPTLSPRCSPSSWACCFSSSATICPRQSRTAPWASASSGTLESEGKLGCHPPLRREALVPGGLLLMVCALIPSVLAVILLWIVILAAMVILPTPLLLPLLQEPGGGGQGGEKPRQAPEYRPDCGACPGVRRFPGLVPVQRGHPVCLWDGFPHVDASGWGDLTIPYSSVTSLEYFEQDPSQDASGFRTNGLGNFKVALGSFENDLYGDYTRYTFASCGACVVLESDGPHHCPQRPRRRQHPGAVPLSFGKDRLGIIPGEHGKNRRNRWGPAGFFYGGVLAFLTLRPARRRSPPRRCAPSPRSLRRTQRFCRPQCGRWYSTFLAVSITVRTGTLLTTMSTCTLGSRVASTCTPR